MNTQQFEVKIHQMGSGHIQAKFFDPKTGKRKRKRFTTLKDAKDFKKSTESRVNSKGVNTFSDLRLAQAMMTYLEAFPASNVRSRKNHFKSFILQLINETNYLRRKSRNNPRKLCFLKVSLG